MRISDWSSDVCSSDVVPLGDLAVEDLCDGVTGELEALDVDVVDHCDRGDVGRDLDRVGATAPLLGGAELALVVLEGGVGAGEERAALDEPLAAGAGDDGLVVHHCFGDLALEPDGPRLLRLLLRRGAATVDELGRASGRERVWRYG